MSSAAINRSLASLRTVCVISLFT
ncbi:unnamed protein product [Kuraishia capsulata CBS 1993]|uniref:Uncharacterized protein n=1 Tax=Kuraishia capsulata CBS 1993 TaxID=1382522 RepID=W6MSW1_9ASCO|nr:unnamed protein product [Kuraishia capsulata CBS 1993]